MRLITTKFFVSPLPEDYILRPALMAKLRQSLKYKLTVLSAPAGFGKTTLVSAWMREMADAFKARPEGGPAARIQPCWMSLSLEDNDAARFVEALITSLEDTGMLLRATTAFLPLNRETDQRSLRNALSSDLSRLQNETVLIFDDYHAIENKEVHELVLHLVTHGPPCLHILLSTRCGPPFETSKLRVSGELFEIGPDDLRFSREEVYEYLHQVQGLLLSEKEVAIIARKTEGWIAGLKMAVLSMQKSADPAAFVNALNGSHRYIFDYLMEQVLARQSAEVRQFLVRTSIVEAFTPALCEALTGEGQPGAGSAQETLAYLERANLFLVPLDDERVWFRYHHLFAELLRSVLQQSLAGQAPELHRRASDWYERNNMIPDAVTHALAAGDVERAAHMIAANVLLLVEQTELKTVLYHLDALFAGKKAVENPWLNAAHAWVLAFSGEVGRAGHILREIEKALPAGRDAGERNELEGNLRAIQAYIQFIGGHHRKAAELARKAAEHLSTAEAAVQALNLTTLTNALSELDAYGDAIQAGQQAVELGNAAGQAGIVMLASSGLAYAYRNRGQLQKSFEVCELALEQAEAYRRKHGHDLPAVASVYACQAYNLYQKYELEQAFQHAKRGLAISETWGQADTKMLASWIMARVLVVQNEPQAARRVIESARQTAGRTSEWFVKLSKLREGADCLNRGDLESAGKLARELVDFEAPFDLELSIFYPLCVGVLIAEQKYEKALQIVDLLLANLANAGGGYKAQLLVLKAWACHEKGEEKESVSVLETALQLSEPELQVAPFIEYFRGIEEGLRSMAAKGKYRGMLERIFAVREGLAVQAGAPGQERRKAGAFRLEAEMPVEPLTERELEILRFLNSHMPTPEIAEALAVSVNTVRTHIKSIYSKLGAHSRSEAIGLAKRLKILG